MSKGSLAIAYSMKRKKMSKGGDPYSKMEDSNRSNMASGGTVSSGDPTMNYAKGGDVSPDGDCPSCGQKMMSKGGEVANSDKPIADGMPAEFDDLHLRDGLEFSETGKNSGDELGGPSKDDLVARAMLRKKKR